MNTMTLAQVANLVGEHPTRIQSWIARNQFKAAMWFGRRGERRWTANEVLRLAIFCRLVNGFNQSPEVAGAMTLTPESVSDGSFFVGFRTSHDEPMQGFHVARVPRDQMGSFFMGDYLSIAGRPMRFWEGHLVREVVALDPQLLAEQVREEWDRLGLEWQGFGIGFGRQDSGEE